MHRFEKWRDALNIAPDEKAVKALMREYVQVIDPKVIEVLPADCRMALDGTTDLQSAAVMILHAELAFDGPEEIAKVLHEIAHTFAAASIRLGRLRTEPLLPSPE